MLEWNDKLWSAPDALVAQIGCCYEGGGSTRYYKENKIPLTAVLTMVRDSKNLERSQSGILDFKRRLVYQKICVSIFLMKVAMAEWVWDNHVVADNDSYNRKTTTK